MRLPIAIACLMFPGLASAADVPAFLESRVYASDVSQCGDVTVGEGLQLSREGVFGYEFGCKFLGFHTDTDPDTSEIYLVVATANCGDDSGINRPDMITIVPGIDNETVRIQSQNEFVVTEIEHLITARLGQDGVDPLSYSHVSGEYKLCK